MKTNHLIQPLITQNNPKTYHKIAINTLNDRSGTRLEEAQFISLDLLYVRKYKTNKTSYLFAYLTHKPESTGSTESNKVHPVVNLRFIEFTDQSKN